MAINIAAANYVLAVDHTISSCSNSGERPYGTILYYSYIKNLSNYVITKRLGYQMSRYYELKNRALVEFAGSYGEKGTTLLLIHYVCSKNQFLKIGV